MITTRESIPARYRDAKLSDFGGIDDVTRWVTNPTDTLFIHGTCGNGKTHMLYGIVRALSKVCRCDVVSAVDVSMRLRGTFGADAEERESQIIREYTKHRTGEYKELGKYWEYLPMFDDLGAHKVSDYAREIWYEIVDKRYRECMPTIYTSNLKLREIADVMGDRIASRLAGGVVYELIGEDRRVRQ